MIFMTAINNINPNHESRIETEKEFQGKNEHELVVPEPKINLNSGIQESPIDLTPKEAATPITNNTTDSIPNKRSKRTRRPPAYL